MQATIQALAQILQEVAPFVRLEPIRQRLDQPHAPPVQQDRIAQQQV